jgi:hypothetical protein
MAFILELLDRYDPDGLELDWMRFGRHFKPGCEIEGAAVLTEFMQDVRRHVDAAAERRGHTIRLGVRVPTRPFEARDTGMDGATWAREGLVDMVVPSPFFSSSDFDIPVELWREQIARSRDEVQISPCLDLRAHASPAMGDRVHVINDLESTRGFAASVLSRGADHVYLFNFMDGTTSVASADDYQAILRQAGTLETACAARRRHLSTYPDVLPYGVPTPSVMPAEVGWFGPTHMRVHAGPRPEGKGAALVVGMSQSEGLAEAEFEAWMNSVPIGTGRDVAAKEMKPSETSRDYHPQYAAAARRLPENVGRGLQFEIPPECMKDGYNVASILLAGGEQRSQRAVWVEIRIG